MNAATLSEDEVLGMMLNIPALEASDDLRFIMAMGATLGGKDGRSYIEYLQTAAWAPDTAETGKKCMDASDASRGL